MRVVMERIRIVGRAIAVEVFPGQPIRYEPAARPRFESASVEAWEAIYNAAIEIPGGECVPVPASQE